MFITENDLTAKDRATLLMGDKILILNQWLFISEAPGTCPTGIRAAESGAPLLRRQGQRTYQGEISGGCAVL